MHKKRGGLPRETHKSSTKVDFSFWLWRVKENIEKPWLGVRKIRVRRFSPLDCFDYFDVCKSHIIKEKGWTETKRICATYSISRQDFPKIGGQQRTPKRFSRASRANFRKTRDTFESGVANESKIIQKSEEFLNLESKISQKFKDSRIRCQK